MDLVFGSCCSLAWTLFILAVILLAGRRYGYPWAPWFWEIALVRMVADHIDAAWARMVSKREMVREFRARTANPRDSKARYNLGVIYMRQKRWEAALEELTASTEINPARADAHLRRAQCLTELARWPEAIPALGACLEQRPDHFDAQLLLGRCYVETQQYDEARSLYDGFLSRHSRDAEAHYYLALVELGLGKRERAEELLRAAIDSSRDCERPNRIRYRRMARLAGRKLAEMRRKTAP